MQWRLVLIATLFGATCAPGEQGVGPVQATGGVGGTGGSPGFGGEGGGPCDSLSSSLGVQRLEEVETKLIVPRCGTNKCHGAGAVFPPRGLDEPDRVRFALVGVRGQLLCKTDFYIDRNNPAKSYLLAVVEAQGDDVTCPSGGAGGKRMPTRPDMVTVPGDRLTDLELECFRWYVQEVGKL